MSDSRSGCGCGCGYGCLSIVTLILVLWALFFGLPTPWGTFAIDLFPPQIRQEASP